MIGYFNRNVSRKLFIAFSMICFANFAEANGNSSMTEISRIQNWSIRQVLIEAGQRNNLPDSVSFNTPSDEGKVDLSLICITRKVENKQPKYSYQIDIKRNFDDAKGSVIFSDGISIINMKAYFFEHWVGIQSAQNSWKSVFEMVSKDKKISMKVYRNSDLIVDDVISGASALRPAIHYCNSPTS